MLSIVILQSVSARKHTQGETIIEIMKQEINIHNSVHNLGKISHFNVPLCFYFQQININMDTT